MRHHRNRQVFCVCFMEKEITKKLPAIAWLKMTDFMHGWLQWELGCAVRVGEQRVVCVQHLPGARKVLRMEVKEDMMEKQPLGNALSATRRNCFMAGLDIDEEVMEKEYGVTREAMSQFVPVECPKMCLTKYGVLRPWTNDVCLGKGQATALQRLLREAFWEAVEEFDREYAEELEGDKYPAIEMVEEFCKRTNTPDMYAPAIRREWQRRAQRKKG